MYFLLSGEGATDMGAARTEASICEDEDFLVGPMAVIVAKIFENRYSHSVLAGGCGFVSERTLGRYSRSQRPSPRTMRLPGLRRPRETAYFYFNAVALAAIASEKSRDLRDEVVAILFRDSDDTASAGRGLWREKVQSMVEGFEAAEFERGVPMVPKPKSEAWLICAFKSHPYQSCDALEERSGNDRSPNSLKRELSELLNGETSREALNEKVTESFEIDRLTMPSFLAFRTRLEEVI